MHTSHYSYRLRGIGGRSTIGFFAITKISQLDGVSKYFLKKVDGELFPPSTPQ